MLLNVLATQSSDRRMMIIRRILSLPQAAAASGVLGKGVSVLKGLMSVGVVSTSVRDTLVRVRGISASVVAVWRECWVIGESVG